MVSRCSCSSPSVSQESRSRIAAWLRREFLFGDRRDIGVQGHGLWLVGGKTDPRFLPPSILRPPSFLVGCAALAGLGMHRDRLQKPRPRRPYLNGQVEHPGPQCLGVLDAASGRPLSGRERIGREDRIVQDHGLGLAAQEADFKLVPERKGMAAGLTAAEPVQPAAGLVFVTQAMMSQGQKRPILGALSPGAIRIASSSVWVASA